jgi:hypothetical protein
MLSYQKLDVYQCAIRFVALAAIIVQKIPRGYSFLADELKRAAVSMPQNDETLNVTRSLLHARVTLTHVDVDVVVDVHVLVSVNGGLRAFAVSFSAPC